MTDDAPNAMAMPMYFTSALPTVVLFEDWLVETPGQYAASWLAILVMGLVRRSFVWARFALIAVNIERHRKRRSSDNDARCSDAPASGGGAGDAELLITPGAAAAGAGVALIGWRASLAMRLFGWELLRASALALR